MNPFHLQPGRTWQNLPFPEHLIYAYTVKQSTMLYIVKYRVLDNECNKVLAYYFGLRGSFIGLSNYSRLWKVMPEIKEPGSNKFTEIKLQIQEIIFL